MSNHNSLSNFGRLPYNQRNKDFKIDLSHAYGIKLNENWKVASLNIPEPIVYKGYLKIASDFLIPLKEKPIQFHLENIKTYFGWEWIDEINV